MRVLVFCTAYITEQTLPRYRNWLKYYREMFPDFDLLMSHDGEMVVPEEDFPLLINEVHIGLFPGHGGKFVGWIRSFLAALRYAKDNGYDRVVHLESDLYLKKGFRDRFLTLVKGDHYLSSWCHRYGFMETAIQIINPKTLDKMLEHFRKTEIFKINELMEWLFFREFKPNVRGIFGNRIEDWDLNDPRFGWQGLDYLAQADYERDKKFLEVWDKGWGR